MIYILRHFKVKDNSKIWLNSREFNDWVKEYDLFELEYLNVHLPSKIDKTYVSSLTRAIKTAEHLDIAYQISDLLTEVKSKAFINTNIKLPKWLWLFIDRVLWFFNANSSENRDMTHKRINEFIEKIDLDDDIFIITHGFFMKQIVRQFKSLGFLCDIDIRPKNGKIYELSKR